LVTPLGRETRLENKPANNMKKPKIYLLTVGVTSTGPIPHEPEAESPSASKV